jgi:transposase
LDLLGLTNYRILTVDEQEYDFSIEAEPITSPSCCAHCGSILLYKHESISRLIMDIPIRGKRVGIVLHQRRYRCRACNRSFFERLTDVHAHHSMTERLVNYIGREALRKTFTSIADDVGLDEWTIRSIFRDSTTHLKDKAIDEPVTILGIDEVYLLRKPRCVLTDIERRCIIDLLRTRDKESVKNYLQRLPPSIRAGISCVCMDMWHPYKIAVNDLLPHATVIVDHFHVVKIANTCLDTVRKELRADLSDAARRGLMHDRYILLRRRADLTESQTLTLEAWTLNFPLLRAAYLLKEEFFEIWNAEGRSQANDLYQAWTSRLPAELEPAFHPLLTAMDNWNQEIMAFFDHKYTNGPTEALNGLLKLAQKMGRGYSFEAIRAKVLLTGGLRAEQRPKYGDRRTGKTLHIP